jgi:hypothetical protein
VLHQQMRALQDPLFRGLLTAARHRQVTPAQHAVLNTRILGNPGSGDLNLDQAAWADVTFITTRKLIAHHVNFLQTARYAAREQVPLVVVSARDLCEAAPILDWHLRQLLFDEHTMPSANHSLYRILHLAIGSKVILIQNLATELGLTNGTSGTVHGLIYPADPHVHQYEAHITLLSRPPILLFKPDHCHPALAATTFPGMMVPGIVPIHPIEEQLTVHLPGHGTVTRCRITRSQLPVMGGYAMTDYKAQGRTFQRAVIDLSVGCTGAAGYVMLSRLTSLQGLAILCPFGLEVLNRPLNPQLRVALDRVAGRAALQQ